MKPDDVPQDVWEYAAAVERVWQGLKVDEDRISHHSRAIMAEREQCAEIAEARRSLPSLDIDPYGTTLAKYIASAIRNRSNT